MHSKCSIPDVSTVNGLYVLIACDRIELLFNYTFPKLCRSAEFAFSEFDFFKSSVNKYQRQKSKL